MNAPDPTLIAAFTWLRGFLSIGTGAASTYAARLLGHVDALNAGWHAMRNECDQAQEQSDLVHHAVVQLLNARIIDDDTPLTVTALIEFLHAVEQFEHGRELTGRVSS